MSKTICPIPEVFVPIQYTNDPSTEDVIFGDKLVQGMVVLLEDAAFRGDPDKVETTGPYGQMKVLETARWARVVDLRHKGPIITFICEYADGSKSSRRYHESFVWYVKRHLFPRNLPRVSTPKGFIR